MADKKGQRHIAIYARTATQEGYGVQSAALQKQVRLCGQFIRKRCEEGKRWISASERCYADDGYSGANINRPGLQALIKAIEKGTVNAVIVASPERLTRSLQDFSKLYRKFKSKGVGLFFANERNEGPRWHRWFDQGIALILAALERRRQKLKIAAKSKRGSDKN